MIPRTLKAIALAAASGTCFFFFWLGSLVLSWVVLPLVRFHHRRLSEADQVRRCQDIVGHGFRIFRTGLRVLKLIDVQPRVGGLQLPERPCVVIANHPTLIDVTAVMALHPRICCVAKTELFQGLLVGKLLRYCGHIEGGNVGAMEGAAVIQQALERLNDGHSVLVFPEGTRSPPHGLGRFNRGVFEIAIRAGVPIVPLFITCEPPTLMKGLPWYALPKRTAMYYIAQLPAVPVGSLGNNSRATVARFQAFFEEKLAASATGKGR